MATWKEHPNYTGLLVSDDGQLAYIREIKQFDNGLGLGYMKANIPIAALQRGKSGWPRQFYAHRLIAETFLGPSDGREVNHIDGNAANNCVDNLEYVSRSENLIHRYRVLKHRPVGSKFSDEQIRAIRASTLSSRELGRRYGVVDTAILKIRKRRSYTHVA